MKYLNTFRSILESKINQEIKDDLDILRDIFEDMDHKSKEALYTYISDSYPKTDLVDIYNAKDKSIKRSSYDKYLDVLDVYRIAFRVEWESKDRLKSDIHETISLIHRCSLEEFDLVEKSSYIRIARFETILFSDIIQNKFGINHITGGGDIMFFIILKKAEK